MNSEKESIIIKTESYREGGDAVVKQHRLWACASVFCFLMVFYTGYKHK